MSRQELVEGYVRGDVTRRTFVRRMTAAGVSLAAALSYAELLRPATASASPGEPELYEGDVYYEREEQMPPDVITLGPSDVTSTAATARAQVDPNRQTTQVYAEYRASGGAAWTRTAAVTAEGDMDRVVSHALTGLAPSTTYEVRAVAENRSGPAMGDAVAFSTAAAPAAQPAAAAVAVAAAAPPNPQADRRAPFARLSPVTTTLAGLKKTGRLSLTLTADEDATMLVHARLSYRPKGLRKVRRVTIGEGTVTTFGGRPGTLKLQLTRTGRRLIRNRTAVKVLLHIHVTDRSGNQRIQTAVVRISG